jgi:hypothetical protein
MDPIIKKAIIKIAWESFEAGVRGERPSEFMKKVYNALEEFEQAEPSLEELDPNAYVS